MAGRWVPSDYRPRSKARCAGHPRQLPRPGSHRARVSVCGADRESLDHPYHQTNQEGSTREERRP